MKLRILSASLTLATLLTLVIYAGGIKLKGIKCVMNPDEQVQHLSFVEYKGGRVFFCCDHCSQPFVEQVAKDEILAATANAQLVATNQAKQKHCPLSGGAYNGGTEIKVAGAEIGFCCTNCQSQAKSLSGKKQLLALFGDAAFKKAGFKVTATKK